MKQSFKKLWKNLDVKTIFWSYITRSPEIDKVIRIKSLKPSWDPTYKAIAWPVMLVDIGTRRSTNTPIWTAPRYAFWRKL